MTSAKDLRLRPISPVEGNRTIRRLHYSGKTVNNSQIHIGVYLGAQLEGALQFGPPLDKSKLIGLVEHTPWNGLLELNRMAFSERLPPNSESRAIAVAMRLLRKHAPQVQWVVSFADATLCGDGTIYRASGFDLTGIVTNRNLARLPNGHTIHKMTLESTPTRPRPELGGRTYYDVTGGRYDWSAYVRAAGAEILTGHQIRYLYFLDPTARDRLTVPCLPFSELDRAGARMYRGEKHARAT